MTPASSFFANKCQLSSATWPTPLLRKVSPDQGEGGKTRDYYSCYHVYNKRQIFRMMRKRANLEHCGETEDTVQNGSVRASSARTSTAQYAAKLLHCEVISHLTCIASLSVLSWHTNYQMRCWNIEAVEPRQIKIMNTFQNLIHGISNDPLPLHHGNYDRIDECVSFK